MYGFIKKERKSIALKNEIKSKDDDYLLKSFKKINQK